MAVSKRLRHEVMRRDNFQCRYCRSTENVLNIDHVVPTTLGGSDDPANLVAACKDCNAGKSAISPDSPLVDDVAQDALRWTAAMKQAEEQQLADLRALNDYVRDVYSLWTDRFTDDSGLPTDWATSAERWFASGLHIGEVQYGIDVAASAGHVRRWDKWKYACGVIYKRLRDRQELAAKLISQNQPEPAEADDDLDDEQEERLCELEFNDHKQRRFLLLAGQDPELARLQALVITLAGEAAINSKCEAHEAWFGDPPYSSRFGEAIESIVTRATEDMWLGNEERSDVVGYLARTTQLVFDTINQMVDLSTVEGRT